MAEEFNGEIGPVSGRSTAETTALVLTRIRLPATLTHVPVSFHTQKEKMSIYNLFFFLDVKNGIVSLKTVDSFMYA